MNKSMPRRKRKELSGGGAAAASGLAGWTGQLCLAALRQLYLIDGRHALVALLGVHDDLLDLRAGREGEFQLFVGNHVPRHPVGSHGHAVDVDAGHEHGRLVGGNQGDGKHVQGLVVHDVGPVVLPGGPEGQLGVDVQGFASGVLVRGAGSAEEHGRHGEEGESFFHGQSLFTLRGWDGTRIPEGFRPPAGEIVVGREGGPSHFPIGRRDVQD